MDPSAVHSSPHVVGSLSAMMGLHFSDKTASHSGGGLSFSSPETPPHRKSSGHGATTWEEASETSTGVPSPALSDAAGFSRCVSDTPSTCPGDPDLFSRVTSLTESAFSTSNFWSEELELELPQHCALPPCRRSFWRPQPVAGSRLLERRRRLQRHRATTDAFAGENVSVGVTTPPLALELWRLPRPHPGVVARVWTRKLLAEEWHRRCGHFLGCFHGALRNFQSHKQRPQAASTH